MFFSRNIEPTPLNILWHYALGYLPDFLNKHSGPVAWCRWSHRGVQFLDKMVIPRKQKPYVFSSKFELRFNQRFEEVLDECANSKRDGIQKRAGQTWMSGDLVEGLIKLHRMGHAHSFETWQDGHLVGGIWGVQLGGLITMSSMFNRVSNASKCAMARTNLHLRDRGFKLVDMGMVPDHLVHFGTEWIPRWKYESMLPELIGQKVSVSAEHPCRPLPLVIRAGNPLVRACRKASQRLIRKPEAECRKPAEAAAEHEVEPPSRHLAGEMSPS